MKEYLLYQAYEMMDVINECKYSLLRLISVYQSKDLPIPEIIIYTDKPAEFSIFSKQIQITLQQVNDSQIKKWRGEINFVHRVKIEIIKDCLLFFKGKVIYCDTDTYILQPLTFIFNSINYNTIFFHTNEGSLSIPASKHALKWKRFLKKNLSLFNGLSPLQVTMWNAGVIGLTDQHLPLLDNVLELTDSIYPLFRRHTAEQFSFAYIFQVNNINILAADKYIFHYWDLKEFRRLLQQFFSLNNDIDDLIKKSELIIPGKIVTEKRKFKKGNLLRKLLLSASGKKWSIENYKI